MEAVGLKTASSCCGQECIICGNVTQFYRCSWCGKPCDDLIGWTASLGNEIGKEQDEDDSRRNDCDDSGPQGREED